MNHNPYEAPGDIPTDDGNRAQPQSRAIPAIFFGFLGALGCLNNVQLLFSIFPVLAHPLMPPLASGHRMYWLLVADLMAAAGSACWIVAAVMIWNGCSRRLITATVAVGLLGQLMRGIH